MLKPGTGKQTAKSIKGSAYSAIRFILDFGGQSVSAITVFRNAQRYWQPSFLMDTATVPMSFLGLAFGSRPCCWPRHLRQRWQRLAAAAADAAYTAAADADTAQGPCHPSCLRDEKR